MEHQFDKLIVVLWILFSEYILVFLAMMADLWSGVRNAKKKLTRKEKMPCYYRCWRTRQDMMKR